MTELVRCFVAVELPEMVKEELATVKAKMRAERMEFLRWVESSAIHLTLKFLGEVPGERVPELVRAVEEAVKGIREFELRLDQLGVFPNLRQPRVLWVGVSGETSMLKMLHENVELAFSILGFPKEEREFKAHLTLARVRESATAEERRALGEKVAQTRLEFTSRFAVGSVSLMKSQLMPKGAVYTSLATARLER